jgi:hypothetical protein
MKKIIIILAALMLTGCDYVVMAFGPPHYLVLEQETTYGKHSYIVKKYSGQGPCYDARHRARMLDTYLTETFDNRSLWCTSKSWLALDYREGTLSLYDRTRGNDVLSAYPELLTRGN